MLEWLRIGPFWALKIGHVGIFWAVFGAWIAVICTLMIIGDFNAAKSAAVWLAAFIVCWAIYRLGQYKGIDAGRRRAVCEIRDAAEIPFDRQHSYPSFVDRETFDELIKEILENRGSDVIRFPQGKTAALLADALSKFPQQYPDFLSKSPKLDDDVRPWLKENLGASDREAHVFGAILSEHFKLLADSHKAIKNP